MQSGKPTKDAEKKALYDYESKLKSVLALGEMTETGAWQRFYAGCCRIKEQASREILVAEKPRDMIVCQERIKAVDHLLAEVQAPVDELNSFINNMPLFAGNYHTRASWNHGLGIVELRSIDTVEEDE